MTTQQANKNNIFLMVSLLFAFYYFLFLFVVLFVLHPVLETSFIVHVCGLFDFFLFFLLCIVSQPDRLKLPNHSSELFHVSQTTSCNRPRGRK
jgi:glucan phosphoethanolaminetransferase (alkaline phosphatase superfamily)